MVRMPIVCIYQRDVITNKILYVQTCNEKTIGSSPSNLLSIEHKEFSSFNADNKTR